VKVLRIRAKSGALLTIQNIAREPRVSGRNSLAWASFGKAASGNLLRVSGVGPG
jgi:hypothetical protein